MSNLWSEMARRANPYIPGEQVNRPNILKLNTNENPYPPSSKVLSAITKEVGADLRLYPSPTMDDLRIEIAGYYDLQKENIFIGNGSDEVLAFSFMAFFDPDKEILFPEVSYSFYPVYANVFNIPFKKVPLNSDLTINHQAFFDTDGGVIFPNPNAPTSRYLPMEAVEQIIKENPNRVVIVDEAYIDFAPESAVSLTKKYDNLLVIQTMSKSRALAGLRVGFALGSEQLIQGLTRMKDSFNSYPVDRLAMAGALAAIQDEDYFIRTRDKIIETREWFTSALINEGFHVEPSATNFLFVTHDDFSAKDIHEQLRQKDVLIRYFNQKPIDNYLRISIGTDEDMAKLIELFKEILQKG